MAKSSLEFLSTFFFVLSLERSCYIKYLLILVCIYGCLLFTRSPIEKIFGCVGGASGLHVASCISALCSVL